LQRFVEKYFSSFDPPVSPQGGFTKQPFMSIVHNVQFTRSLNPIEGKIRAGIFRDFIQPVGLIFLPMRRNAR
jgi:hypothetical protein